jgi:plasmid stabilization system protein ParE
MTRIEFHPEAELDLESARSWYRERSHIAAQAFVTEVLRALKISQYLPTLGREPAKTNAGLC